MKLANFILGIAFSLNAFINNVDGQLYKCSKDCFLCCPLDYLWHCPIYEWCMCLMESIDKNTHEVDYDSWVDCLAVSCPRSPISA
ncbi:UNVERIFIED_CONTAM: hypothetical protein RMT77_019762 [Armadillidium vulgare]